MIKPHFPTPHTVKANDAYPSRVFPTTSIQQRLDSVVYSTHTEPPIEQRLIDSYRSNGYMALHGLLTNEEVDTLQHELNRLRLDKNLHLGQEAVVERKNSELRSLFQVQQHSGIFLRLMRDPRLLKIARHILGSDVYIHQSRINFKPAFTGKDFYWHSDFETWHTEDGMPRMRAISVVIMLTETNEHNGPLMFIPKSHLSYIACVGHTPDEHYKQSLQQQQIGTPDRASLRYLVRTGGIDAPKGPAGTIVIFDCNIMHGSNSNITPFPRSSVFFVYNSVHNRLETPFAASRKRPEYLAARENCATLTPADNGLHPL